LTEHGTVGGAGVALHFRAWGPPAAPGVLLLHGLSGFSYDWERSAPKLATNHRVIALDLRGFGESDFAPDGRYTLRDFSADLDAVAAELLLDRFALVGHSLGGRIALYYAATRPAAVSALVLVDAVPEMNPDGSRVVRARLAASPDSYADAAQAAAALAPQFSQHSPEQLQDRLKEYLRPAGDGRVAIKRDPAFRETMPGAYASPDPARERSFWALAHDVRSPSMLLRATHSTMTTPELAERLRSEIPSLEVVELDASHNLPADEPDRIADLIRAFLAKQRSHAYRE